MIDTTNTSTKNVSYRYFQQGKEVAKTIEVSKHCFVDIDEDGFPIGMEII